MDKNIMFPDEFNPISLREERKKTGRYIALALALCITLLGLYQAMVRHTPMVAGLFAPAIIMFLYVFWVLYTTSRTQRRQAAKDATARKAAEKEGRKNKANRDDEEEEERVEDYVAIDVTNRDSRIEEYLDNCTCSIKEISKKTLSTTLSTASNDARNSTNFDSNNINALPQPHTFVLDKWSRSKLNRTYSIA